VFSIKPGTGECFALRSPARVQAVGFESFRPGAIMLESMAPGYSLL